MRQVQIYIEDTRESGNYNELELFQDETININLSVQNVKDISKVFTEFTQSFTVPASKTNNAIFRHFYENAVEINTAVYDPRLRRPAYIEINRKFFRNGKIQLEKSNLKNGQVESYTITFYGTIINLKDIFGEDKLSDLDYTSIAFNSTGTEVYNRITDYSTDYDVRYPLISSDRLWSYGDSTSTDITTNAGAIAYSELNPALKVRKIFDLIALKYGINFTGLFLSDARFNDLFLWYKQKKENTYTTDKQQINIISGNNDTFQDKPLSGNYYAIYEAPSDVINSVGSSYFPQAYFEQFPVPSYTRVRQTKEIKIHVTNVSSNTINYYFDVFINGQYSKTITGKGIGTYQIVGLNENGRVTVYAYSDGSNTIDTVYESVLQFGSTARVDSVFSKNAQLVFVGTTNLSGNAPNIKVSDFVSGILKMFNLTITAESIDTFLIEPLDWWYTKGGIIDITRYVDTDSIDVAKVPLYNQIDFKFKESKSFLNTEFKSNNGRDYGNVSQKFFFDGGKYEVQVPFENLLQTAFEDQALQVGYVLDENQNSYVPEPILLYQRPLNTTGTKNLKFDDGSTIQTIGSYVPLSQDVLFSGVEYTLNFSPEQSSLLNLNIANTHYATWYKAYFDSLFDYKNRLVTVKTVFPISILTNLRLNDRLIIRDKRYIINQINANLNTGEVSLELMNDLRAIANDLVPYGSLVSSSSGSFNIPVNLINGATEVSLSSPNAGVSLSSTTLTADSYVTVTYPANPTAEFEIITEDGANDIITSDLFGIKNEESTINIIQINQTHTLQNGGELVNYTYIEQQP